MEDIKVKALKKYWVVLDPSKDVIHQSISGWRKGAISSFLDEYRYRRWQFCYKQGYRCIKVNIEFQPTK